MSSLASVVKACLNVFDKNRTRCPQCSRNATADAPEVVVLTEFFGMTKDEHYLIYVCVNRKSGCFHRALHPNPRNPPWSDGPENPIRDGASYGGIDLTPRRPLFRG